MRKKRRKLWPRAIGLTCYPGRGWWTVRHLRTALCNFCIKSGILCPKCQEKVSSGQVTETDIRISRLLLKLEEKYPALQKIDFHNAYEAGDVLAIVVGQGDLKSFLSEGGKILRDIADNTGKRVRIFESKGDIRRFLEELFFPVSITTINKIWLPDGSREIRVILAGRPRRLPLKAEVFKELAKKIRGINLSIAFEKQIEEEYV